MKHVLLTTLWICAVLVLPAFAQDTPSPTKHALTQPPALKPWTGDLDGMVKRRVIRVLVAPSRTSCWLNGARQTGKSTLAQWLSREKYPAEYLTLDDATVLAAARQSPQDFIANARTPVIIDEIQRAPELFLSPRPLFEKLIFRPFPLRGCLSTLAELFVCGSGGGAQGSHQHAQNGADGQAKKEYDYDYHDSFSSFLVGWGIGPTQS